MKGLIAWGVISEALIYFCVGFTTLALLTYADDGVVDVFKSVIVGGFFGLFQVARFSHDAWMDRRDGRRDGKGLNDGRA